MDWSKRVPAICTRVPGLGASGWYVWSLSTLPSGFRCTQASPNAASLQRAKRLFCLRATLGSAAEPLRAVGCTWGRWPEHTSGLPSTWPVMPLGTSWRQALQRWCRTSWRRDPPPVHPGCLALSQACLGPERRTPRGAEAGAMALLPQQAPCSRLFLVTEPMEQTPGSVHWGWSHAVGGLGSARHDGGEPSPQGSPSQWSCRTGTRAKGCRYAQPRPQSWGRSGRKALCRLGAGLRSLCRPGSAVLGQALGREQACGLALGTLAGCCAHLASGVSVVAFGSLA